MKSLIWICLVLSAAAVAVADDTVWEALIPVIPPNEAGELSRSLTFDNVSYDLFFPGEIGEKVRMRFNVEKRVVQVIASDEWTIQNVEEFTLPGLFR